MAYEKAPRDDSVTETRSSSSRSLSVKDAVAATEKQGSVRSSPPTTPAKKHGHDLDKAVSAKEAREELNRVMTSGEGVEYPSGIKLGLVTLALCLSVFLMALVRGFPQKIVEIWWLIFLTGQHDYCDRYSENHGSVSQSARCGVVRIGIPSHNSFLSTPFWEILHILFD